MLFSAARLVFVVFLPVILCQLPFDSEYRFHDVKIFGDSYSDTGNLHKLSNGLWPIPPYYNGRYCNGPNWVDQLQGSWLEQLKGFNVKSYAYGGATTDNNFVQGAGAFGAIPVPSVADQVEFYLNEDRWNKINFDRTLYIFWAGGNDFANKPSTSPAAIIASLLNSVNDLAVVGGKHFLVFNAVPVQSVPATSMLAPAQYLAALTGLSNSALTADLATMRQNYPQANFSIFDINSLVSKVVASKSGYFTNAKNNCWNSVNATTIIQICTNPDKYVFVDLQHFTEPMAALIANAVRQFVLTSYDVNSSGCYVHAA
ncbi:unnamed protein product [Adineta steineri]|uniref:Carbohydrate esterase family 16 protein n=1 Tax=Adineta steineri TaxID=433720 RepID=A0A815H8Q9_9BILA|nr:unnamed protein product [Adineta steineri]CAF1495738.1 unnamed protein product [Adineta steineri]CAF1510556.1 unnamed protein product [Adineta steineri]